MGENVSFAKINIDCSQGNFQLLKVEKFGVKYDQKTTVSKAIGVRGGAGFKDEEGGGEITAEVFREEGTPEVDYEKLFLTKEKFKMTTQDFNGRRKQFRFCRVSQIPDYSADTAGAVMDSVKIVFLQSGVL